MIRIGLTGGLGTGKTTVLAMFKRCGAKVLDSDAIVHAELKTNRKLQERIKSFFGPGVFRKGVINKPVLAQKAFARAKDLKVLNALIHPLVRNKIFEFFAKYKKSSRGTVVAVEVPLLFETGFDKFFDATVVVTATPKVQRKRMLKKSGSGSGNLRRRMQWQLPEAVKIARCDFVIDNNGDQRKTFVQVKELRDFLIKSFENKEEKAWKRKN